MLVATFGPTTAWVGKTITWGGAQFVLEGYGRVPAAALFDYDGQGHLQWASADLRTWAWYVVQWEAAATPPAQAAVQPYSAAQPAAFGAAGAAGARKPFPVWAIVLIVAAVLLPVGGMFAAIMIPMVMFNDQHDKASESAVKEGIHTLQIGIQSWAVDHQDAYPSAEEMDPMVMSRYIDWWPTNPYTGAPMAQGTGPGDFSYEAAPDGSSFRLVGYGEDGNVVIDIGSSGGITV